MGNLQTETDKFQADCFLAFLAAYNIFLHKPGYYSFLFWFSFQLNYMSRSSWTIGSSFPIGFYY